MRIPTLLAFLTLASAPVIAHASDTVLPDACGQTDTRFDVKTQKAPSAPSSPESGKATIVVLGEKTPAFPQPIIRYGMDGSWVGAMKSDSYFVLTVAPGEHHFCGQWQSSFTTVNKNIDVLTVNAEAGKTYYVDFAISAVVTGVSGGGNVPVTAAQQLVPHMTLLADDKGKFQVKKSELSLFKEKK